NLGELVSARGQPEAALPWFDQAAAILEPVLAQQPQLTIARLPLRDTYWGRAFALTRLGRHAEALPEWDRAFALEIANDRYHAHPRLGRAETLALVKDHTRATSEANAVAEANDATAGTLYDAACIFALSVKAEPEDAKLTEQYASRAVELLRQAVAKGYKN